MTDYTELIRQLKTYEDGYGLYDAAAAAIEELQAEKKKTVTQIFGEEQQECEEYCTGLMNRIKELKAQLPKRGEWIRVQEVDIPGEIHPVAFRCMCSTCRNDYIFPKIPQYCPDCGSMNTAKMEVQE